ncbi:lytic transglycosylase domain-containing protein [Desulfothermus sp.]
MTRFFSFFIIIFILASSISDAGTIYFFKDKNGVLHFTDIPDNPKYRPFISDYSLINKKQIKKILKRYCQIYNVDYYLAYSILKVESNFNPHAVSQKGAKGLMQIVPVTQRELKIFSPFDPEENIEGGVRYLRKLMDRFNRIELVIAAYNAGPNAVIKYNGIPPYKETKNYVKKVLRLYKRLKNKNYILTLSKEEK